MQNDLQDFSSQLDNALSNDETKVEEPTQAEEPKVEEQSKQEQPKNDDNKNNSVIKQIRDELKETKARESRQAKLLESMMLQQGVSSMEELEEKLQAAEDKKNAENKGIPVETQQKLRELEQQVVELKEQNKAANFNMRANNLMNKYTISEEDFVSFCQECRSKGFDVLQPNMDLEILYEVKNLEKIKADIATQTRQSVLQEIKNQRNTSSSVTTTSKTNNSVPDTNSNEITKDDLQSFLNSITSE